MPKQNPKHMKKRVGLERQQTLVDGSFPTRYLVMALIFIAAVTTIIVLVVTLNNNDDIENTALIVEEEDYVILEYKVWKNPDGWSNSELLRNKPFPDFSSKYETNVSKSDITPLGLYYKILGMKVGQSKYFSIEPSVDEDGDGLDDNDGKEVEGYGKSRTEYYNVRLTFYVEITNVTKGIKNVPKSSAIEPSESILQSLDCLSLIDDLFLLNDLF